MEIEYVDKKKYAGNGATNYRVTISNFNYKLVVTREYFNYGFYDGEKYDEIFISNDSFTSLWKVSIMTKKFDDSDYLKKIENDIILIFLRESKRIIPKLNEKLKQETKETNDKLIIYNDIVKTLCFYERLDKLKKIKNNDEH